MKHIRFWCFFHIPHMGTPKDNTHIRMLHVFGLMVVAFTQHTQIITTKQQLQIVHRQNQQTKQTNPNFWG